MSGVLCPLCGQRSSYTGHVCWVEHPHVTATSESTNPISSMTIVTDNTAVIRAIEENNREIFVQRNEALEQLEPLKARIAELEAALVDIREAMPGTDDAADRVQRIISTALQNHPNA